MVVAVVGVFVAVVLVVVVVVVVAVVFEVVFVGVVGWRVEPRWRKTRQDAWRERHPEPRRSVKARPRSRREPPGEAAPLEPKRRTS